MRSNRESRRMWYDLQQVVRRMVVRSVGRFALGFVIFCISSVGLLYNKCFVSGEC